MPVNVFHTPHDQQRELILAALRVITADHYARESDPYADAEAEYATEQLALAARNLVNAVNTLPAENQPSGWNR